MAVKQRIKIQNTYLVSALVTKEDEIVPKTVRPIHNTFVAIDDCDIKQVETQRDGNSINGITEYDESMQLYLTDEFGVLSGFDRGDTAEDNSDPFEAAAQVSYFTQESKLYFPPPQLITYSFASDGGEGWVNTTRSVLKELAAQQDTGYTISGQLKEESNQTRLRSMNVSKFFEDPGEGGSDQQKAYRDWFQQNAHETVQVLVVPRVRSFIVAFSRPEYEGAQVKIFDYQGRSVFYGRNIDDASVNKRESAVHPIRDKDGNTIGYGAAFVDTDNDFDVFRLLNKDVFRVKVTFLDRTEAAALGLKHPTYELAEKLRFNIKNMAGEFDIINGDAISLEEAMIKQFPMTYRHLIEKSKGEQDPRVNPTPLIDRQPGFKSYFHGLKLVVDKTKWASGILGDESSLKASRDFGRFIYQSLETSNPPKFGNVSVLEALNIAFQINDDAHSVLDKIEEIRKSYDTSNAAKSLVDGTDLAKTLLQNKADYIKSSKAFEAVSDYVGKSKSALIKQYADMNVAKVIIPDRLQEIYKRQVLSYAFTYEISGTGDTLRRAARRSRDLANKMKAGAKSVSEVAGPVADGLSLLGAVHGLVENQTNFKAARSTLNHVSIDYANKTYLGHNDGVESKELDELEQALEELSNFYDNGQQVVQIGDEYYIKVKFEFDESVFDSDHSFQPLVDLLNDIPAEFDLHLLGYTCDIGTEDYNHNLSLYRAQSVQAKLEEAGLGNGQSTINVHSIGRGIDLVSSGGTLDERRVKSRRVEAAIQVVSLLKYYPSREGMDVLEKFRNLTTVADAKEIEHLMKSLVATIDFIMGIPPVHPAHAVASVLWQVGKLLVDVYKFTEKSIFGEDYLVLTKKLKDIEAYTESNLELTNIGQNNDESFDGSDYIEYQLRMRAKALYGLMRLLLRCQIESEGWKERILNDPLYWMRGRDRFTYSDNLEYYHVNDYIEKFLLNDGWSFPKSSTVVSGLDDLWVHMVREGIIGNDDYDNLQKVDNEEAELLFKQLSEGIFPEELLDYGPVYIANPIVKALDYMRIQQFYRRESAYVSLADKELTSRLDDRNRVSASFSQSLPIHNVGSSNLEEFATDLKPAFTNLDSQIYLTRMIMIKEPAGSSSSWKNIKDWLGSNNKISAFHPIQIRILLDPNHDAIQRAIDEGNINLMPVEAWPTRVDGFNIEGPPTSGFFRNVAYDDLNTAEKQLIDAKGIDHQHIYGAFLNLFYTLGMNQYFGTKPMAGSLSAWYNVAEIGRSESVSGLWHMDYCYETMVAYDKNTRELIEYSEGEDTVPLEMDQTRVHNITADGKVTVAESILFDKAFLKSRMEVGRYRELFDGPVVHGLLSIGGGGYLDINHDTYGFMDFNDYQDVHLPLPNFNWQDDVTFGFLVVCDELETEGYENRSVDWRRIPAKISLTRRMPLNMDGSMINYMDRRFAPAEQFYTRNGPSYDTNLKYIGTIENSGNGKVEFKLGKTRLGSPIKIEDRLLRLLSDQKKLTQFTDIEPSDGSASKEVYFCSVQLSYQNILGENTSGLKPFACDILSDEEARLERFVLGARITSQDESGLENTKVRSYFDLPYPKGLNDINSHWYKPQNEQVVEEALRKITRNKINIKENKQKEVPLPLEPITPMMIWKLLEGDDGNTLNENRKRYFHAWSHKQAKVKTIVTPGTLFEVSEEKAID